MGGFKFAADKIKDGAVNGMESLLNMMFKDPGSGGVVTLGNVILTLVSKIMPGADSDDVVQAQISTTLLQDLESILDD